MKSRVVGAGLLLATLSGGWAQGPASQVRQNDFVDGRILLQDLRALSADDMAGRQVDTPGGAKARAYVIEQFTRSGVKPFGNSYERPFTFMSGRGANQVERHGVNVIGVIPGSSQPARYIVVSAHYDHVGVRNAGTPNEQIYNGADDNASGTAALFALAKYFSRHKPRHSLVMAAFDAEESGLRGAYAFVKEPPVGAADLVVDVNMDMIGRDPDDKLFAVGTLLNPFLKPHLERVAGAAPVKLLFGHEDPSQKDVEDWTRDSDHWAFQQAKIPAIYLGVEDFAQHHKPTDDYETITFDFYIRATETAIRVVREFDASLK